MVDPVATCKAVDEIYKLYPRHVGRLDARKAIRKAVQRVMEGEYGPKMTEEQAIAGLKERTRQFAESAAGQRGVFTPYPATWFNKGRYLDDPKEWEEVEVDKREAWRVREANVGVWRPS